MSWWCFKFSLRAHCCLAVHMLKALHSCKLANPHSTHSWGTGQYYFLSLWQQILRPWPMIEMEDEKQGRLSDLAKTTHQLGGRVNFKRHKGWPRRALGSNWPAPSPSLTFVCLVIQGNRRHHYSLQLGTHTNSYHSNHIIRDGVFWIVHQREATG